MGGIIFSNHKAPIRQIRDMAQSWLTWQRINFHQTLKASSMINTILHYLIMESFDTVGADVSILLSNIMVTAFYNDFTLTPNKMDNITEALSLMKANGFPITRSLRLSEL